MRSAFVSFVIYFSSHCVISYWRTRYAVVINSGDVSISHITAFL